MKLATSAGYSAKAIYSDRFQNHSIWLIHLQISCPSHPLTEGEFTRVRIIRKLEECVQESLILRGNSFILCML